MMSSKTKQEVQVATSVVAVGWPLENVKFGLKRANLGRIERESGISQDVGKPLQL